MYLLGLGIILLVLKYLDISPVDGWTWWQVLTPFGLTMIWWTWADWSGYTKRRAMARSEKIKQQRLEQRRQAILPQKQRRDRQ
jgi:small Trp-rich protein